MYELVLCSAMGNRRFAQISTSDEEEEAPRKPSDESHPRRKRLKRMKLPEEEDEQQQQQQQQQQKQQQKNKNKSKNKLKEKEVLQSSGEEDDDEEPPQEDAKTIGDSIRLSGKGRGRRSHYEAFEFDGNRYDLVSHLLGFSFKPFREELLLYVYVLMYF